MKKTIQLLNKYFYELIFMCLVATALFNGFNNIGIWQDGLWYIAEILDQSISIDRSRFFAHIALHIPTFCLSILGFNNVEYLKLISILHGIWFYLLALIPLSITYYILPKDKRHWFVFPLISYLLSRIFASYFVVSEMYITLYLFWLVLMMFLFVDFRTISLFKQIVLVVSCLMLIGSYQIACLLSFALLTIGLIKFHTLKKQIPHIKKILFYICFFFLLCAVIVNFYYLLNPLDTNVSKVFDNLYFLLFLLKERWFIYYFIIALTLSLINYKNKYIKIATVFILIVVSAKFMLNNIDLLKRAHDLRNFATIFSVFFSSLLIFMYYLKRNIDFVVWKNICAILLCIYIINTSIFSSNINLFFKDIVDFMPKNKKAIISIDFFEEAFPYEVEIMDRFVFPRQVILVQNLYSNNRIISTIVVDKNKNFDKQNVFYVTNDDFISKLKKFGIYYSDDLIKEINSLQ